MTGTVKLVIDGKIVDTKKYSSKRNRHSIFATWFNRYMSHEKYIGSEISFDIVPEDLPAQKVDELSKPIKMKKIIVDSVTGKTYENAKLAAADSGLPYGTFYGQVSGYVNNKTTYNYKRVPA